MLALRRSDQLRAGVFASCRKYLATQSQPQVDAEYSEQAEYPEIQELSFRAKKQRQQEDWHEEIRQTRTVEEKLIKINMPRYWGYKVVDVRDENLRYNCLPALQHYTRTVLEEMPLTGGEKAATNETSGKHLDSFVDAVKSDVIDGLEFAYDVFRSKYPNDSSLEPMEKEKLLTQLIVEQLNRSLLNGLSADSTHLNEVDVDYNPRHEAFWQVGGIAPPKNVIKSKEGREWQKEMANDSVDRFIQYVGTPYLALRHGKQLQPWKTEQEYVNAELAKEIPRYNHDPRTLGYTTRHQHGLNIPGYWPTARTTFGTISYQSRCNLLIKPDAYTADDVRATLDAQALQSSYAWLLAQANYNGFNTYNEITYPMNTQTIVTNGQMWSFYEYQLNTLLVHSRHVDENPRVNFMRGTGEMPLYESVDDKGKVLGFNDTVLKHLVQFYANEPIIQRPLNELQPYLDPEVKRIADYSNEEQREFLEKTFKHITANRPRHLSKPEIYLWEKLYKIDYKTRPMEPKRRFFELDINPWNRTLDQHQKVYIPRAVRPEGPKSKKKWKPTYYP